MMWLPPGRWIRTEKILRRKPVHGYCYTWGFRAGIKDLIEIASLERPSRGSSPMEADRRGRIALRVLAYNVRDIGWTTNRYHARFPGMSTAYCGRAVTGDVKRKSDIPCKYCQKILNDIFYTTAGLDEPETYYRVSSTHYRWGAYDG